MSGIATKTSEFVRLVEGTGVKILDTRKTVPGLRLLDKWAVNIGGGENHRFGLYDMALIKENHITAAGGINPAVNAIRKSHSNNIKIEVEVKNLVELQEALELEIDIIMLDNFPIDMMQKAVKIVGGKVPLEASGNVSPKTVRAIAETGVDYISIGMLTHSVKALDISLIIDEVN
jgi:nicotinate-nucleotide pyrophosphorylase (carboxylating)